MTGDDYIISFRVKRTVSSSTYEGAQQVGRKMMHLFRTSASFKMFDVVEGSMEIEKEE